jgi:ribosomal-protein-alanine N-acetyltransferase
MDLPITVRRMEEGDLDEILTLEASSSLTPWSRALFLEEMSHLHGHCFSMILQEDLGSRIVAYLCFRTIGEDSELLNLTVHPDYRRRGLARHLMAFYFDFCRREKVTKSFLEAAVGNKAALHLYRSLDYRPSGKRPKFYLGRFDALIMEKEFAENRKNSNIQIPNSK